MVAKTWNEFWTRYWPLTRPKSGDAPLARFKAVKDAYTSHLKPFVRFLEESKLELDFAAVKAYFVHVNESSLATSTKLNRRSAVKARLRTLLYSPDFTQQAGVEGMLRSLDYSSETRAPMLSRTGIAEDRIVRREEFDRLVSNTSKRTSLSIWFLYNTGCRISEMCSARLEHSEDLGDMVRLRVTGKRKKDRKVDIQKSLFEAIRAAFPGETYLFQTKGGKPFLPAYVSYEITKAGRRILGRRISAHTMRHSFATLTIREGASIKAVSEYLGHANVSLTMAMYVHETLETRQRVMREFPPVRQAQSAQGDSFREQPVVR
jgi:integrase